MSEWTRTAEDHPVSLWELLEEERMIAQKLACCYVRHIFFVNFCAGCMGPSGWFDESSDDSWGIYVCIKARGSTRGPRGPKNCNFGGAGLPKVSWSKTTYREPFFRSTNVWPILGGSSESTLCKHDCIECCKLIVDLPKAQRTQGLPAFTKRTASKS